MLKENLAAEIVSVMKSKNRDKITALKAIKAKFQEWVTEKGSVGRTMDMLTDAQEISILKKLVEEYEFDANQYKDRLDEVSQKTKEAYTNVAKFIQEYIPKEATPDEIKKAISESGIKIIKPNMKKLVDHVKSVLPNADGKTVFDIINSLF